MTPRLLDELDWLLDDYLKLSSIAEGEFSTGTQREHDTYARDCARAAAAIAAARELIEQSEHLRGVLDAFGVLLRPVVTVHLPGDEPEPLPPNWWTRHGHYDDGETFDYCSAVGPEQAHCVRPEHDGQGGHLWAWHTREQRERAEATVTEIEHVAREIQS